MPRTSIAAVLAATLITSSAGTPSAEEIDPGGTLNPDEMSLSRSLSRAREGEVGMVVCSQGYLMTKRGDHEAARTLFEACAEAGYTGTMTWMSYMDTNGFGAPEDPEEAAAWDRRAAEAGDPVGAYNYGLDLLRGYGVPEDEAAGREWIDRAADAGLAPAVSLREGNYDPALATPDADDWRYRQRYY